MISDINQRGNGVRGKTLGKLTFFLWQIHLFGSGIFGWESFSATKWGDPTERQQAKRWCCQSWQRKPRKTSLSNHHRKQFLLGRIFRKTSSASPSNPGAKVELLLVWGEHSVCICHSWAPRIFSFTSKLKSNHWWFRGGVAFLMTSMQLQWFLYGFRCMVQTDFPSQARACCMKWLCYNEQFFLTLYINVHASPFTFCWPYWKKPLHPYNTILPMEYSGNCWILPIFPLPLKGVPQKVWELPRQTLKVVHSSSVDYTFPFKPTTRWCSDFSSLDVFFFLFVWRSSTCLYWVLKLTLFAGSFPCVHRFGRLRDFVPCCTSRWIFFDVDASIASRGVRYLQ